MSLVVALSCRYHWFCRRSTGTHYSERNEKISSWKSSNIKLFFVSLESCLNFPTILINVATVPVTSKQCKRLDNVLKRLNICLTAMSQKYLNALVFSYVNQNIHFWFCYSYLCLKKWKNEFINIFKAVLQVLLDSMKSLTYST